MTRFENDQFAANTRDSIERELSIEELEAIAAGGWFSSLVHRVVHDVTAVVHAAAPYVKVALDDALHPWKTGKYL